MINGSGVRPAYGEDLGFDDEPAWVEELLRKNKANGAAEEVLPESQWFGAKPGGCQEECVRRFL